MTQEENKQKLYDIVLEVCPLGCNRRCSEIWINEIIGHRIICKCTKCDHDKKEKALQVVVGSPATSVTRNDVQSSSFGKELKEDETN